VAFVSDTTSASLILLDATLGVPLRVLPVVGPPSSTPVITSDSVYMTGGTSQDGIPALDKTGGVYRFALPPLSAG
jgi:hypothetical protein